MRNIYLIGFVLFLCMSGFAQSQQRPNIVYILADDLGIGDVSAYNVAGKIKTPNIDLLAGKGVRFTDAHTSSAVCTPTRYSILTGRYNWRTKLKSSVLFGYDKALIEPKRETVASFLQKQGYQTGVIGKWHLGWNWANIEAGNTRVDFSKPVQNSPNSHGFNYSFCIAGSLDMAPYVYLENGRCTSIPVDTCPARTGVAFFRSGITAPDFKHEEVLTKMTEKAVGFIQQHAGKKQPFFLYFPLTAPHTPVLPTGKFKDKNGITPYADFVMMVDDVVGQVANTLKASGVYENTLIVFASDNGFAPAADLKAQLDQGHNPSMQFRGTKADIFEGGHRVPLIVSWPQKMKQPRVSSQLICSSDFFRTVSELMNKSLADQIAEDSFSFLPEITGQKAKLPKREAIVHHSIEGYFAIRKGNWKLILCSHSGGWSNPKPASEEARTLPPVQLYDLNTDIGETRNVYDKQPEMVKELTALLTQYVQNGRSTPGTPQINDGPAHWPQLNWMAEAR
jgi:arylsulfatase A